MQRYRARISGPLLDRIDIHVNVTRPEVSLLDPAHAAGESSAVIRARVARARWVQMQRAGCPNARLEAAAVNEFCALAPDELAMLEAAVDALRLSPRACHRVLKVARTVADLDGTDGIEQAHLAQAIGFRQPM